MSASDCQNAFSANGALATAVAGCFESLGRPQFNPTSAYSCVSTASIYCQLTTASCDPYATPAATPINGGFESGDLSPWVQKQGYSSPDSFEASVTSERSHSGGRSLKFSFTNVNAASVRWEQDVKLVPGAKYELSYWWYSVNSQASCATIVGMTLPGTSVTLNIPTVNQPTNQWLPGSTTFVAPTSFGKVYIQMGGNKGSAANTMYVDDVELKLVS